MDYFKCEACNGVYQEGEEIHEQVSGRTGGYDNWMPDEDFYYCPHCDANITESGSEEYGMEDAIEELDELRERPTCEEVEALRAEIKKLKACYDPENMGLTHLKMKRYFEGEN